jgi:hypothetical protein
MALNMSIIQTSGTGVLEVPDDVAADLQDAYDALEKLPVNRAVVVDFETPEAARLFVRQGNSWADQNDLRFARKGDIKGLPTRVTFRIYAPRPAKDTETE